MSAFRGRNGPNLSRLIDDLNVIPTNYEANDVTGEDHNLDATLDMFTNTEFMDFDGAVPSHNPLPMNYDFGNGGKFTETDFGTNDMKFEELLRAEPLPMLQTNYNGPNVQSPVNYHANPMSASPAASSPLSPTAVQPKTSESKKRLASQSGLPDPASLQEESQKAAEDDKRRRNTAASARFRVKKKLKEQAMEQRVKDVDEENSAMKAKIKQLEMENKWLKNLVIEKKGKESEEDLSEAYQKFRRESEERDERKTTSRTDGVGTRS